MLYHEAEEEAAQLRRWIRARRARIQKEEEGEAFLDGSSVGLGTLLSLLICLMFDLTMA